MPYTLAGLPTYYAKEATTEMTLAWMKKAAWQGLYDSKIRLFAEKLVKGVAAHDYLSEYAAVLNWVRMNIRYSRDPEPIEQLKLPRITIETGTGDCDDMSILIAALVGSLGAKVRFVAAAFSTDPNGSPALSHVWCEAFEPGSKAWIVLDPVPGRKVNEMLNKAIKKIAVQVF